MSVAAIFSGFAARITGQRKRVDPRISIKAALEAAVKRRDTREIHKFREALKRATTEILRSKFSKRN